ncbi:MAG: alpha/beta fold hydrolase [Streptosporangiales bacterium]|nr:alpha/beta fold hydrolase [Streptosporangiales bacterium]
MGTKFLELADGRIAYDVAGPADGRLIVCVQGVGDTRKTFRFLAPKLAAAGYRVAAMDVRGYGESSTGWPGYGVDQIASDVLALIRHLGGPAVVVGHSIGSAAAAWAAAEGPDDVTALVLIASEARDTPIKAWMKPAAKIVARSVTLWGMYYRSLHPTRPADFVEYLEDLKANLREPGRLEVLRTQLDEALAGIDPRFADARPPALIVMGTKDRDMRDPEAEANLVADKLAGPATVELVQDAGHYPHVEMPEVTETAIRKFLAEV